MDQEFVTTAGKAILNSKRLLIQQLKFNFWKTAVGEISLPILILSLAVFSFLNPTKPFSYFATAVFVALFFSTSFKQLYTALIKKSYSGYISINKIKSFELKPDKPGLEIEVRVHLKNNRYRSIMFRTMEKEYELFVEQLSQYLAQPQLA